MDLKSASKLGLILFAINGANVLLSRINPVMDLSWIAISALGLALWIFSTRPFYKNKLPGSFDSNIGAILVLGFFLYVAWYFLAPMLAEEQVNSGPCSPNSIEKRCYTFTTSTCSTVWSHFENDCREEVKKTVLAVSPSALTGPMTKRCIYKRLDSSFQNARRSVDDALCKSHFKEVTSQGY